MGDGKKKSRSAVISENWSAFRKFLYDSEKKTVLGRGANSWTKILVFYVFYYGFLAALFAASITLVLSSLDEYTPRYQTRLQTPGVAVQPKIPSHDDQTSDIRFSVQSGDKASEKLVTVLDKFLKPYASEKQTDKNLFQNCSLDMPPSLDEEYNPGDIAKACTFDVAKLGACMTSPYGYDVGSPCVFVKLNRIINWFPIGYTNLDRAEGNDDSDAPPLRDILATYGKVYRPYLMYTACYGASATDEMNLNGGDRANTKYYPSDNGFPFGYYPYLGKLRQPQYLSPLVAVQFTNVTRNVEIKVNCKVYALNIRDNKEMGEGFFSFKLEIKD